MDTKIEKLMADTRSCGCAYHNCIHHISAPINSIYCELKVIYIDKDGLCGRKIIKKS